MTSELNMKNMPLSLSVVKSYSANLIGPAVPMGSSSRLQVTFTLYCTKRSQNVTKKTYLLFPFLDGSLHHFRLVLDR
jgi:hypothetical protein